jgi:hypothetical protein
MAISALHADVPLLQHYCAAKDRNGSMNLVYGMRNYLVKREEKIVII